MELKQIQEKALKVFFNDIKKNKIKVSKDYFILKLTEELGEFVQSYLVHEKRCRPEKYLPAQKSKRELSKELADVLGLVLVIAKELHIDVEEAIIKKWITKEWIKK